MARGNLRPLEDLNVWRGEGADLKREMSSPSVDEISAALMEVILVEVYFGKPMRCMSSQPNTPAASVPRKMGWYQFSIDVG